MEYNGSFRTARIRQRSVGAITLFLLVVHVMQGGLQIVQGWTPTGNMRSHRDSHASTELKQAVQVQQTFSDVISEGPRHDPMSGNTLHLTTTTGASTTQHTLSPFERLCANWVDVKYHQALDLKCPFMRRRATDILDSIDEVMRFLVIRHKSLHLLGPPPAYGCDGDTCDKLLGLTLEETKDAITRDWKVDTKKGYYITGRLNATLYRDDCFFDGPDPDMPIRGLRKYLNAASQLFEQKTSRMELLSLETTDDGKIVAEWRMNGVLRLPWKPKLPTWTGITTYHLDHNGLIYKHTETWDMSVIRAFVVTLWPDLARYIWRETGAEISPSQEDVIA